MTLTNKQRRARGLDQVAPLPVGRLPWKARDILRQHSDGSSELLRWAIDDADGNEMVSDFEREDLRDQVIKAVNLMRSAGKAPLKPAEGYLDPMSILSDAVEILLVVLEDREEAIGDKDEVLRDLIKRVKKVVAAHG
jgi:hypothetical protein